MKKAQREVYVSLVSEIDGCLCPWCQYCNCYSCGDYGECAHRLHQRLPLDAGELFPGDDCWGFRPNRPVSEVADIIGICLAKFDLGKPVAWYEQGDQLIVAGTPKEKNAPVYKSSD